MAEDSRAEDEEEMRRLRAAAGGPSGLGGRRSLLPPIVCSSVPAASAWPLGYCEVGPCSRHVLCLLGFCPSPLAPRPPSARRTWRPPQQEQPRRIQSCGLSWMQLQFQRECSA